MTSRPSAPTGAETWSAEDFGRDPNPIAHHYSRFRVAERLLLTGHSHQAWPDAGFHGQLAAWADAAELVDEKWARAEVMANRVRRGFAERIGARAEEIALGQNTHELVLRFLSALPLVERPRLVTTDGEFHTIRRQLDRIAEDSRIEIVKVGTEPPHALAERLVAEVNDRTAAVLVSSILYATARVVTGLSETLAACREHGAELLVDAYHQVNVRPLSVLADGLGDAFVVGGGYKYCQLGEGNAFLRVPPGRDHLRPVLTGWFSEFGHLAERTAGRVPYGSGPERWAGATYDPTSHYRAASVFDFFEELGLTPGVLSRVNARQMGLLADRFDRMVPGRAPITRDRSAPLEAFGGFLALRTPLSGEIAARLRERQVHTDVRGDLLRLGPAPYHTDQQLHAAMNALEEVLSQLATGGP